MTIPLIAFFYLYLLFVLVWLIFNLIAFYHIIRYGQISIMSFVAVGAYLATIIIISYLSYQFLSQINWEVGITVLRGGSQFFGANNL